jgi:hypothetical protein
MEPLGLNIQSRVHDVVHSSFAEVGLECEGSPSNVGKQASSTEKLLRTGVLHLRRLVLNS